MKSTAVFFLVCICIASAVELRSQNKIMADSHSQIFAQLKQIQSKDSNFGNMLMSLAELHMTVGGPLDQLIEAVQSLQVDLKTKTQNESDNFDMETINHNNRVKALNAKIDSAESDITNTQSMLSKTLYPRKAALEQQIKEETEKIRENIATTNTETEQRQNEAQTFASRQVDHKQVDEAVDEAIALVRSLKNKSSFIQVRQAKAALKRLHKMIVNKSMTQAPMVEALVKLSQNFSDQTAVDKVLNLLEQLKDNTRQSLDDFTQEEQNAIAAWEVRLTQLKQDLARYRNTKLNAEANLKETNRQIQENENFLAQRKLDLVRHQDALEKENNQYQQLTETHEDTMKQLAHESDIVQQAVNIFENFQKSGKVRAEMKGFYNERANRVRK